MAIERARLIEIVVSVGAVLAFVAVLLGIGLRFNQDGLDATGGIVLVATIAVFILLMAVVGYVLANMAEES